MKVFVATCDDYVSALTPYAYLFNKFWSDDIEVTVLNRGTISEYELPKNFSIIALGSNNGSKGWTTDFHNYFSTVEDDYFIFMQEDHFFIKPFNEYVYEQLLTCLDDNIGRIDLTNNSINKSYTTYRIIIDPIYGQSDVEVTELSQTSMYRVCCQPSIWSKEYMLKYMKPGLGGPWEFELQDYYNDGYKILGTNRNYPVVVSNALVKGEYSKHWYKCIHGDDYFELDDIIIKHMKENQII